MHIHFSIKYFTHLCLKKNLVKKPSPKFNNGNQFRRLKCLFIIFLWNTSIKGVSISFLQFFLCHLQKMFMHLKSIYRIAFAKVHKRWFFYMSALAELLYVLYMTKWKNLMCLRVRCAMTFDLGELKITCAESQFNRRNAGGKINIILIHNHAYGLF